MLIGHMYAASPFMGARYYWRILLTVVRGSSIFEHLRTVDRVVHQTFKAVSQIVTKQGRFHMTHTYES